MPKFLFSLAPMLSGLLQGVNFAACQAKKQLQVLDWTKLEAARDREEGWTTLFDKFSNIVSQEVEGGDGAVSFVLDDVSALKWRFGDAAVLDFVRCCKTLTHERNVSIVDCIIDILDEQVLMVY